MVLYTISEDGRRYSLDLDLDESLLLLSGVPEEGLSGYKGKIDDLDRRFKEYREGSTRHTAQDLHDFLWDGYDPDKRYKADVFYLDQVIDGHLAGKPAGNCLGLTALYAVLAAKNGLDVSVLDVPKHILIRVRERDGWMIDIENTNPRGFGTDTRVYGGAGERHAVHLIDTFYTDNRNGGRKSRYKAFKGIYTSIMRQLLPQMGLDVGQDVFDFLVVDSAISGWSVAPSESRLKDMREVARAMNEGGYSNSLQLPDFVAMNEAKFVPPSKNLKGLMDFVDKFGDVSKILAAAYKHMNSVLFDQQISLLEEAMPAIRPLADEPDLPLYMAHLLVNYPRLDSYESGMFGRMPMRPLGITPGQFIESIRKRGLAGKEVTLKDVEPEIQERFAEFIRRGEYFGVERLSQKSGVKPDPDIVGSAVEDGVVGLIKDNRSGINTFVSGLSRLGISLKKTPRIDRAREAVYNDLDNRDWEQAKKLDDELGYDDGRWRRIAETDARRYLEESDLSSAVWVVKETGIKIDFAPLADAVQNGYDGIFNNTEFTPEMVLSEVSDVVDATGIRPSIDRFGDNIRLLERQLGDANSEVFRRIKDSYSE